MRLPVVAEAAESWDRPTREASLRDELRQMRVLVIDDIEDARDATRAMLEHLGADVLVAADGQEALDLIRNADVDVILCDLQMANMDGYEFIRALRHRPGARQPPVIAVSGQASSADHRRTHAAGFDGHIDKPFVDTDLVLAVATAMARRGTS